MHHTIFAPNPTNKYKVAILIKHAALDLANLTTYYANPLITKGMDPTELIGFSLEYNAQNKAPVSLIKYYLNSLLPALDSLGVTTLVVADSAYFKTLTGQRKAEPHHGYILPCAIKGYKHFNVILSVNYQALFYNPTLNDRLTMSLETLVNHLNGTHKELGAGIIHSESYPRTLQDIKQHLDNLHQYPALTCDIEAFSLEFHKAGIGTIAFAWDQHNGIAFPCDYLTDLDDTSPYLGTYVINLRIRALLLEFFITYKGKLIFHNAGYDVKVLIFYLFMDGILQNTVGMNKGIEVFHSNIEDTKIITYLATNSTAGNDLKLKTNAFEFAGNYAQDDIHDIRYIELDKLLTYNLTDCLATWYVYNKNTPIMIQDQQQQVYEEIFKASMPVICAMELTGAPLDMGAVLSAKQQLLTIQTEYEDILNASMIINDFEWDLQRQAMIEANNKLVNKVKPLSAFNIAFNPASPLQIQQLLHDHLGFPIIDTTDTNQPATGAKTLKKHLNALINEYDITEEELNE